MKQTTCWRLRLKTTDAQKTCANLKPDSARGEYVDTEGGYCYVLAATAEDAAAPFGAAVLGVGRVGIGYGETA